MTFLLSCISTKHSMLKKHWTDTRQGEQQTECPLTVLGSHQKPKDDQGGLVCLLDDSGNVRSSVSLSTPAGMAQNGNGVLVATLFAIHEVANDLSSIQPDIVSLPAFNMLHSLSRTRRGYLVASTGLDAILEFTPEGELLWNWWATDYGFDQTPTGEPRYIDKEVDYRGTKFGTLAQTTHVNSAAELPDGTVLASLFHQGMIISIDRESGAWQPVIEGLDHPHSVRILNDQYFTLADTARGRGLLIRLKDGKGQIEAEVDAHTSWLQDCSYDYRNDYWVLVDGKNSRVDLRTGTAGEKSLARFDFDPEWRLYEVLPLS